MFPDSQEKKDLSSAKERVKEALKREQEERYGPKKRRFSLVVFSSPRTKRAGPKGLRAESARAFTGRQCPHSRKGEDFLTCQPDFFTETVICSIDKNCDPYTKI